MLNRKFFRSLLVFSVITGALSLFLGCEQVGTTGKKVTNTWTEATANAAFGGRYYHTSLVYDDKMWVIGGTDSADMLTQLNDVWYSADGITWTEATANAAFPPRFSHVSGVIGGNMWVIGGWDAENAGPRGDAWYSADGALWEQAVLTIKMLGGTNLDSFQNLSYSSLFYGNDGVQDYMILFGGWSGSTTSDAMYITYDGFEWLQLDHDYGCPAVCGAQIYVNALPPQIDGDRTYLFYDLSVLGGTNADMTTHCDFYTRMGVNKYNDGTFLSTMMFPAENLYSADQNRVARSYASSVVYNDAFWLIGGVTLESEEYNNDIVFSNIHTEGDLDTKGRIKGDWTLFEAEAQFSGRGGHTSVVFNDRMWVIGGFGGEDVDAELYADVWYNEAK